MEIRTTSKKLREAFFALPLLFDGDENEELNWLKSICEEAAPFPEGEDVMPQRIAIYPRLGSYKRNGDETQHLSSLFEKALAGFSTEQLVRMRAKIRPFTQLENTIETSKIQLDTICLLVGLIAALKKEILTKVRQDQSGFLEDNSPLKSLTTATEAPFSGGSEDVARAISKRLKRLLGETALQQRQLRPGQPFQLRARTAHERSLNAAYTILRPPGFRIEDDYVDEFFFWSKIRDSRDPQQTLVKIFAERRLGDLSTLPDEISEPLVALSPLFGLLDIAPKESGAESLQSGEQLEQMMLKTILAMKPFRPKEYYQHPYEHLEEANDGREVTYEDLWWVYFQIRDAFQEGMREEVKESLTEGNNNAATETTSSTNMFEKIRSKLENQTLRSVLTRLFPGVDPQYILQPKKNGAAPHAVSHKYFQERFKTWAEASAGYFSSIQRMDISIVLQSFFDAVAHETEESLKSSRIFEHLQNVIITMPHEMCEEEVEERMNQTWGRLATTTGVEIFDKPEKAAEISALLDGRRELEKKVRSRALARLIRRDDRFATVPMQVTTITDQEVNRLQHLVEDHPEVRILLEDGKSVFMVTFDAVLT